MSERGGPTTQSGIYYQNSIAALYLGRLCDTTTRLDTEQVIAVRVEAPVEVDDIVVTFADEHCTHIQAKESIRSDQAAWQKLWHHFDAQYRSSSFKRTRDQLHLQVGEPHEEHANLRQICERVAGSETYEEWWQRLTGPQQSLVEEIKLLLIPELQADGELLAFFSHVHVEVCSLVQIERDFAPYWMPQSSAQPGSLFRLLRDRVGGAARVRGSFTAQQLRQSLETEHNIRFHVPPTVDDLRAAIRNCCSLLRQQKHTIGHTGRHVPRVIVSEIAEWIRVTTDDQNVAMLLDQAGSGKTVVMRDVLHALEEQGITVFAVKADLQLSHLAHYEDISVLLHLPDTVERSVARMAAFGPICVLIDQVDALSLSLARDQTALNILLELVAQLRLIPNVRILLSCRTFDFHSDPRLRRTAVVKQFHLDELAAEDVRGIMAEVGIAFDALSPATQILLRIPLHLDLFMWVMAEQPLGPNSVHALSSLQDLYSLLWRNVVLKPEPDAPTTAQREEVLLRLTEDMDSWQRTSAPQALLTKADTCHLEPAAYWLASAGILIPADNEWIFLHQTFFDYCYAKLFVEKRLSLTETVINGEQGLFARSQVIQVLMYLRGSDPQMYLREFNQLLARSELRFHLHDLLLRWFGSLPAASDEEWVMFQRMVFNPLLRPRLLQAIQGNVSWFDRLNGKAIQNLLALDDLVLDNEVIPYLTSMLDLRQAAVITLLRPYLGRSTSWDNRLAWAMLRIGRWQTGEAVALFEAFIRATPTLNLHRLHELDDIAKQDPRAGCRLIQVVFDRLLEDFLSERATSSARYPLSLLQKLEELNGSMMEGALQTVCEAEPDLFLEQMLPWLERVMHLTEQSTSDNLFFAADEISSGWYNHVYVVQHQVIHAFIDALVAIASKNPEGFQRKTVQLAALPFQTPQQLLAKVYTRVAENYTGDALVFLLSDQRRLNLGDHEQYETRQLITALSPYLSEAQFLSLETEILEYSPIWGYGGTTGLRWRGLEQFHLLQAVPFSFLTQRGVRSLRELQDKFPQPEAQASKTPIGMQGGSVGSPISPEAAQKMSDGAWLSAMRKYYGHAEHQDFLKGGAYQLGHLLTEHVKDKPMRFWNLLEKAPDDLDDNYVQAFLNGFSEADAPAEWLFETVRRFAPQPGRNLRRTIAWALEKRTSAGIPVDLLALLENYVRDTTLDLEQSGEPDFGFLNSDRGSAFRTLVGVLNGQETPKALEQRWTLLEFVSHDLSTSLRVGAIEELLYVYHDDNERAVSLFEDLLEGHVSLLSSHRAQEFVYYGLDGFYKRMQPVIRAMMHFPTAEVQQRGAELACIAAISPTVLQNSEDEAAARALAKEAMSGPADWRRGAARIYAHNLVKDLTGHCMHELVKLVDDEDDQVRRSIAHLFHSLGAAQLYPLRPFMEAFAASRTLTTDRHQFAEYLWEHGLLDPTWTLSIVHIMLNNAYSPQKYPSYGDGEALVRLLIRIYTDPTADDAAKQDAINTFDCLLERYQGDAQRVLSEWDRR